MYYSTRMYVSTVCWSILILIYIDIMTEQVLAQMTALTRENSHRLQHIQKPDSEWDVSREVDAEKDAPPTKHTHTHTHTYKLPHAMAMAEWNRPSDKDERFCCGDWLFCLNSGFGYCASVSPYYRLLMVDCLGEGRLMIRKALSDRKKCKSLQGLENMQQNW